MGPEKLSRPSLDLASPQECRQDVPYVGEDPGYRGDNLVYLCRSLSLTPLRHQQSRPAEDSGLRCAERHQYTIAFAEPEPRRSQATKPSFSNFSRSSFNMSIQYVKQKSQMRLPRGLRSDTESKTESELSSCESTEVGCLIGLASEVVSSCKQSCCMRYLAHRVRPTRIHSVGRGGTGQRMIAFPL